MSAVARELDPRRALRTRRVVACRVVALACGVALALPGAPAAAQPDPAASDRGYAGPAAVALEVSASEASATTTAAGTTDDAPIPAMPTPAQASAPSGIAATPARVTAGEPEGPGRDDEPGADSPFVDAETVAWRDTPEGIESQRLIVSGAVALGLGVLVGIGAVIMGTSDPCDLSYGNSCQEAARDRAAWTMGGPAIGVVAIGGSVLGVGLWRRAQARRDR